MKTQKGRFCYKFVKSSRTKEGETRISKNRKVREGRWCLKEEVMRGIVLENESGKTVYKVNSSGKGIKPNFLR